jgi:hypothetical protein
MEASTTQGATAIRVTLGGSVTLATAVQVRDPVTGAVALVDDPGLELFLTGPDGVETTLAIAPNEIVHDSTGHYHAEYLPDQLGAWAWRWLGDNVAQGASEGTFSVASIYVAHPTPPDVTDVRMLVPQVQRAVEGVVRANWTLDPDEVKDLVADAAAEVVLYCGSLFGAQLVVTHADPVTQAPDEYATSTALSPAQGAVIAAQAALNYFFYRFSGSKMSERIADEASEWEYTLSPSLLQGQLRLLQQERDRALDAIPPPPGGQDVYVSFLAQRDTLTSRLVEPWVYGHPEGFGINAGGLEGDFRFDVLPSGGGDWTGLS